MLLLRTLTFLLLSCIALPEALAQSSAAEKMPIIDYRERFLPVVASNGMVVGPERLASEIEVIMVARLENALREASEEIRRQVRNHIEIVLPEILDELAREEGEPPELE